MLTLVGLLVLVDVVAEGFLSAVLATVRLDFNKHLPGEFVQNSVGCDL